MSEDQEKPKIIKLSEVKPELQKKLGDDKIFRFECDIIEDNIRIGLREINSYSPYYYEVFHTYEELKQKNPIFNAMNGLEAVKKNLFRVFKKEVTTLKSLEDDQKIQIIFPMALVEDIENVEFILERKTIENKNAGLKYLYEIQKNKIKLMTKIMNICKDENYQNEKITKDILNILNFSD